MANKTDFKPPEVLDFRQDDRKELSIITVHANHKGHAWIHAGDVNIVEYDTRIGLWMIEAKNLGATDFEHDTEVMFRIGLVGVAFRMAESGRLWISAFIAGDDPGGFCVPQPGWNQLEGATKCIHERCRARGQRHLVVNEDRYIPPPNPELFDRLRGLRIEIVTGRV